MASLVTGDQLSGEDQGLLSEGLLGEEIWVGIEQRTQALEGSKLRSHGKSILG